MDDIIPLTRIEELQNLKELHLNSKYFFKKLIFN